MIKQLEDELQKEEFGLKEEVPVLIFVIGGVTFGELRIAYQMREKTGRKIFIGSGGLLTPLRLLENAK
jgi:syntaxin-binding protein 1